MHVKYLLHNLPKKLLVLSIVLFTNIACNQIKEENRVLFKGANDSLLIIKIPTASCENCQKVIEEGLFFEKGVKQSILDLNTKKVSIVYNPNVTTYDIIQGSVAKLILKMPCK